MVAYVAYADYMLSLSEIGRLTKRTHATIINSARRMGELIDTNPTVANRYKTLTKLLKCNSETTR